MTVNGDTLQRATEHHHATTRAPARDSELVIASDPATNNELATVNDSACDSDRGIALASAAFISR
ncbi:hypothetical protein [Micromonospora sp. WMMD736]|uniref:hypothetical protein n=1 Tax=Micromonospora sp. WMMD736 TaxID=3404112 RepID=UPI003B93D20A